MGSLLPTQFNKSILPPTIKESKRDLLLFGTIFLSALFATPLVLLAGNRVGYAVIITALLVLILAIVVMLRPIIGLFLVAGAALIIEQNPIPFEIFTDRLPIFYWPPQYAGLPERPIGFLILYIFFALFCHRFSNRKRLLDGGPLLIPLLCYLACVGMGIIRGMTSGGDFKIIVLEVRPFWYTFVAYLLTYNLITKKIHLRALVWLIIAAAAFKGLQGTYIFTFLMGGTFTRHDMMAHEETFFFVALLLLIALFILHHRDNKQLQAALFATPFVLVATYANQRRTGYVALLLGLVIAWVLVFLCKPKARSRLSFLFISLSILAAIYIIGFSDVQGPIGSPARSIISVFYPTAEEASSNLYRDYENYDLEHTVQQSPIIGWGFGKQFLQPFILPDIFVDNPYYLYIPHNTIYWVWMRLGIIGFTALWFLFGSIIVRGIQIARQLKDPYLQLVAIYVVALTFMEVIVAYADYQLFFYRNVIYLGILAGVLMRLPYLDKEIPPPLLSITKTHRLMKREVADAYFDDYTQSTSSRRRR